MEGSRILYLIGGIIFLVVSLAGGVWWEFLVGEVSKPALYIGLSPFHIEAKFLNHDILDLPFFVKALLLSERLLAILQSIMIVIGALAYRRTWSTRLVNISPFVTTLGFILLLIIGTISLPYLIPSVKQVFPNLTESLVPYSNKYLMVNLYPLTHIDGSVEIRVISRFTIQFLASLTSGIICFIGALVRRAEIKRFRIIHGQGIFE
ncbi:MAG: hypothetical protein QXT26_00900 [Thermoproteota archaeon]